jgi:hypothetical protein
VLHIGRAVAVLVNVGHWSRCLWSTLARRPNRRGRIETESDDETDAGTVDDPSRADARRVFQVMMTS